ncbi:MAG: hypothetical protein ACPH3N_04065 [Alcanivorax sediminis]|uniref:DUF2946 domain-containing protein n=1 Tax=Alcanivorax sediminis TaxID=2663008 RepID=A0A6N7LQV1_9GAMM|nr:hypothetical protein [Alcanivorax sediminis]MQX52533.1 hypothetical protein [Alcanivorax sediminis]
MKSLVWTLLLIICTHVLVLDAVHHEHDAGADYAQSLNLVDNADHQDRQSLDVLDQGAEHCCQCHGFMAGVDCSPARQPAPLSALLAWRPDLPEAPPESPFRPPIA